MSALSVSFQNRVLAWSVPEEDDRRFRAVSSWVMGLCLLFALLLPWIPLPERTREDAVQPLPPPLAKLLLDDKKPLPPPTPAKPIETAQAQAEPVKPQKKPDEPTLKAERDRKQPPVAEARNPIPGKPPGEALDAARRKATGVGLLAMKDQLTELHSAPTAVQLNKEAIKPGLGVGTGVGAGVGAGNEQGIPVRSMITSNATGGSGGINTAGYSRNTGGGGLAGRSTTLVEGTAGGGGGGGPGGGGGSAMGGKGTGAGSPGGTLQKGSSGKASRSIEEIRLVFERNKGAIYAIYNRALREDPGLQGKVVVELKIAPAGQVVSCRIVSSELKAPELEQKLLARIQQFDFGAKDVDQMVVTYPMDFLPS
ncbi:AgmX/PglI C-terminal domain-containing protein [Ideonella sp. DXS29W]|uniref:AgmX/PglI C-terminal domain-containing protein n=1 Tax=Ideonella lacteola TaxID=2984193 RepID=A0ABU9BQD6_9BURK